MGNPRPALPSEDGICTWGICTNAWGVWSLGDYALEYIEALPLSSGFPERENLFFLRMRMVPGRKKKCLTLMGMWTAQIEQISHVLTQSGF